MLASKNYIQLNYACIYFVVILFKSQKYFSPTLIRPNFIYFRSLVGVSKFSKYLFAFLQNVTDTETW